VFLLLLFVVTVISRRPLASYLGTWITDKDLAQDLATIVPPMALFAVAFLYNVCRAPRRLWLDGARRERLEEHEKIKAVEWLKARTPTPIEMACSELTRIVLCSDVREVFLQAGWSIGMNDYHTDTKQLNGIWICGADAHQTEKMVEAFFEDLNISYEADRSWAKGKQVTVFFGRAL
jgi:hypothetical protein